MGASEQNFLEFLEQPVKLKIFLVLVKQNVKTKLANEKNQIFLNKNNPTAPRSFFKYNKSIEKVMQGIVF